MRLPDLADGGCHRRGSGAGDPGVSTLELMVALTVTVVALVVLVPRISSRPLDFTADLREFTANLDVARGLAQSRTLQYRVRVLSRTEYAIERGVLVGATWTFPAAERRVTLHPGVEFAPGSVGQIVVYDSRGRLAGPSSTFILVDLGRGWSRQVLVRTTGMVEVQ